MVQGLEQADAKAHATAAQIWAEMLGLVCHPEYYKLGEQKVTHVDQDVLTLGFRRTLCGLPRLHLLCNISRRISLHNSTRWHKRVESQIQKSPSSPSHDAVQSSRFRFP